MYFVLSAFDFTLTLGLVHSVGAERIEPAFKSLIHQYRVTRYGPDGASTIEAEEHTKAEKRLEEERKLEKGMTTEEKKKHSDGGWGSRAFWAEVVLAYTIHKTALLPLRAGLTVAWTPRVVKWLASKGWIGKVGQVDLASRFFMGQPRTGRLCTLCPPIHICLFTSTYQLWAFYFSGYGVVPMTLC